VLFDDRSMLQHRPVKGEIHGASGTQRVVKSIGRYEKRLDI
jgi:hypothetical protein